MAKKKKTVLKLEMIGAVYAVEETADGWQRREEIDSKTVLNVLLRALREHPELK